MPVTHLEVLVEEQSMEVVLRHLLPTIVSNATFNYHPFQGKAALLQRLARRLRGLRHAMLPGWAILVVVDRDHDDCMALKRKLDDTAKAADLATFTHNGSGPFSVINRIAIEELEAWYFGDWAAVTAAFPRVPASLPRRSGFRDPDAIQGGTWEAFQRILMRAGYYPGGIPQIDVAQRIAPHMDPARNTSRSFQAFRDALQQAARA